MCSHTFTSWCTTCRRHKTVHMVTLFYNISHRYEVLHVCSIWTGVNFLRYSITEIMYNNIVQKLKTDWGGGVSSLLWQFWGFPEQPEKLWCLLTVCINWHSHDLKTHWDAVTLQTKWGSVSQETTEIQHSDENKEHYNLSVKSRNQHRLVYSLD